MLRIDPSLNSPRAEAPAPSNLKKPGLRTESQLHRAPAKAPVKKLERNVEQYVEQHVEQHTDKKIDNAQAKHISQKSTPAKSKEVKEIDDDLLFSAELESQMENDEIATLGEMEGLEEIPMSQKQAATALSAIAGLAAVQAQTPVYEIPVEVIFDNAPKATINSNEPLVLMKQSDLQALLSGAGELSVEMPPVDAATLYTADSELLAAPKAEGEVLETEGKLKLSKTAENSPKVVDNVNVIDLLNQKKNLRNPVQAQYANQNPKFVLEKIMKEVKAKAGVTEMSPDEVKMMKNIDILTDADKMVKMIGGEKELDSKSNMSTKATDKVFDMSKVKTSNATEIIDQITNHIIQNQTARSANVELAVNHADLGRININVSKLNPEQVNIQIMTHTPEGKQFFAENSRGLLSHLASNGVNVADLKLDNTASSNLNSGKDNSNSSEQFSGNSRGQHSPNQSEDNNRRQDSKRREDLWDLYRRNAA